MDLIIRTENESNFNWLKKVVGEEHSCEFKKIPEPRHLNASYVNVDDDFHVLPKKIKELLTGNSRNYRAFVNSTHPFSKYTNSIEGSWNENMNSRLMIIWVCFSPLPHQQYI